MILSKQVPKTLFVCLLALVLLCNGANGQELQKNSISGNALGICALSGMSYERIFFDLLVAEVGIGLVGIGGGLTLYPLKASVGKVCPYSGIKYTFMALVDVGGGSIAYVPFGITYFSKWGLNFGLDLGPAFGSWEYMNRDRDAMNPNLDEPEEIKIWGNAKIGIRF